MTAIVDLSPLQPEIDRVVEKYVDGGLKYGWKSTRKVDYDFGHWNNYILPRSRMLIFDHMRMPMIDRHPEIKTIWGEITRIIGPRVLLRSYINGYTYGTDAYYHQDDSWIQHRFGPDTQSETALLYLNKEWNRDWGGETSIINSDDMIEAAVLPKRNRLLIFDSLKFHSARPLSRACPVLRSVLAFKTGTKELNNPKVEFVLKLTEDIKHSKRTLFEHLYMTALQLEKMKAPEHVVYAGLYHSIYGTEFFDGRITISRDEVRAIIGEHAEELVYEFCTTKNRADVFINNLKGYSPILQRNMLYLEYANLKELSSVKDVDPNRFVRLEQAIQKVEDVINER